MKRRVANAAIRRRSKNSPVECVTNRISRTRVAGRQTACRFVQIREETERTYRNQRDSDELADRIQSRSRSRLSGNNAGLAVGCIDSICMERIHLVLPSGTERCPSHAADVRAPPGAPPSDKQVSWSRNDPGFRGHRAIPSLVRGALQPDASVIAQSDCCASSVRPIEEYLFMRRAPWSAPISTESPR